MQTAVLWLHIISSLGWLSLTAAATWTYITKAGTSDPKQRLIDRAAVLGRLMPWTWVGIVTALATGTYMIVAIGDMSAITLPVIVMSAAGILMTAIFKFMHAAPWQHLGRGIREEKWEVAEFAQGTIRSLMVISLGIGIIALVSALYR